MSGYQRINFKDQNVERPKTYDVTNNPDGSITLIESFGNVEELGTPINQENMNHIEDGIDAVSFSKFNIDVVYKKDDLITDIQDNQLKIFKSLEDNNFGHLPTEKDFWEEVEFSGGAGQPIGLIYPLVCNKDYIPDGSLPTDGTEYSKAQFRGLWTNYLTGEKPKLNICTFADYEQDLLTYGQCAKFAIDLENEKFRVPLIKDGAVIQQALTNDELGKSYNAGLPNITGNFAVNGSLTPDGAFTKETEIGGYALVNSNPVNTRTGFDASLSNPIYGNSDTVQMNAVAMRYFVVVANGSTNESLMDWSAWASNLQGKANVDLSNITELARKTIANMPMPSNEYTELTIGASGTEYTAQANGYFVVATEAKNTQRIALINTTNGMISSLAPYHDSVVGVFVPAKKNDVIKLEYTSTTISYFRFIYAEGEK